jgi:hypothetical protein
MNRAMLVLAVLVSLYAIHRVARTPIPKNPAAARALLERLDRNEDHQLSREEYEHVADGLLEFALFDLDKDTVLTLWEVDVIIRRVNPTILRPVHSEEGS